FFVSLMGPSSLPRVSSPGLLPPPAGLPCGPLDPPEDRFEVALPVEPVVVHRVAELGDLLLAAPVPQRVRRHADELGRSLDAQIAIKPVHRRYLVGRAH